MSEFLCWLRSRSRYAPGTFAFLVLKPLPKIFGTIKSFGIGLGTNLVQKRLRIGLILIVWSYQSPHTELLE